MFAPYPHTRIFYLCAFLLACTAFAAAQINFTGPHPGDVYREYTRTMPPNNTDAWRVTDPNVSLTLYPQAAPFLPNPSVDIGVSDLSGAVRAEAVISMWGGHVGTTGKKIRFNGNSWIVIPELGTANGIPSGHNGECYISGPTVVIPVPLGQLHSGTNYFEGTNAGQTCYTFQWGQHGWYNLLLRIYYDPASKSHPTGAISSVANGGSLGENPTITTSVTSGSVDRIDILASYFNYSSDGDGLYNGYHYDYFPLSTSESAMTLRNHVGTATGGARSVTWATDWVPDQAPGAIKLLAHIRDGSTGVWYCTEEVTNVSLVRTNTSVKLYTPTDMPERAWARGDLVPFTTHVTIPAGDNLATATGAVYHVRTWNGIDGDADPSGHYRRLNDWTDGDFGANHFYSYDLRTVPVGQLRSGTNTFTWYSATTAHHGMEILWPGPALVVRYGSVSNNNPPSITTHPIDQTVGEGETATFTVGASGSGTLGYQWQRNQSDIGGATSASYTTPVLTPADSGSRYRCVVTNSYGQATSNEALLRVTHVIAPIITVEPVAQTVQDGQPASFAVTATGSDPLTYQWQKNSANITNTNNPIYSITAAAYADSGALFRCIVSNSKGADTSVAVMLRVTPIAPAITTHPVNAQVSAGDTAVFTVVATGSLPLTYAWEKNGTPIGGATAATYSFVVTKADSGAAFRCKVTNGAGSVTSNQAFLIVSTFPPKITAHPVQVFVRLGQTATFTVAATGTKPLTYQWQRDSADISGANSPSYTTPPVVLDDNGRSYRCVITNNYGTAISEAAVLSVTSDAVNLIANGGFEQGTTPWMFFTNGSGSFANDSVGPTSEHAADLDISSPGDNVQLSQMSITLDKDTAYTLLFKAYSNSGHDIDVYLHKDTSPYTNYGLSQVAVDLGQSWKNFRYNFTATGFSGTVSDGRLRFWLAPYDNSGDRFFVDDVVLVKSSMLVPPTIMKQPLPRTVNEGETASFSVVVTGTTPFTYQWEKNQVAIPGATSASYTTPPVSLADDKSQFRCVVSNLVSSATSDPATLSVLTTDVKGNQNQLPTQYYLAQNHPNPFNPSTNIEFGLPTAGHVTLKVSNLLGQEVRTLVDDFMGAGTHQVTFHAEGLPSGLYLYRLQTGNFVATKKLVLIK